MRKILFTTGMVVIALLVIGCPDEGNDTDDSDSDENTSDGNDDSEGDYVIPDIEDVPYREMQTVEGGTYTQYYYADPFEHTISTFSIAKYEVTYELWYVVYNWAKSQSDYNFIFSQRGTEGGPDEARYGYPPTARKHEPVTIITWCDAIVFCNAYSMMTDRDPCYTYQGEIITEANNTDACEEAECDWTCNGYRLPTEGESQFAASNRGATNFDYVPGDSESYETSSNIGDYAWYSENSEGKTHNVGTKTPNELGLFDLAGNVKEWCWDKDNLDEPPVGPLTDYRGPDEYGYASERVIRGGSYDDYEDDQRVGDRDHWDIYTSFPYGGFRVAQSE